MIISPDKFKFLQAIKLNDLFDHANRRMYFTIACKADIDGASESFQKIAQVWQDASPKIAANIFVPSKAYILAMQKAAPAFNKSIEKGKAEELLTGCYGCSLQSNGGMFVYAYCREYQFSFFMADNYLVSCFVQVLDETGEMYDYVWMFTVDPRLKAFKLHDDAMMCAAEIDRQCINMALFEKYCSIDNIFLGKGSKAKDHNGEKVRKDSGVNINLRTSLWYTNIIRDTPFMVSGHMRLQPTKNGKKLIYIEPFEKKGYHRTCNKLNAQ